MRLFKAIPILYPENFTLTDKVDIHKKTIPFGFVFSEEGNIILKNRKEDK